MDTEQCPLNSGFGPHTTAAEIAAGLDLKGKTIIVTGGHSGIGLETTRVLSEAGASVLVGARDLGKARAALAGFGNAEAASLDLSDPDSVDRFSRDFLDAHGKLDILINNAGIMATPLQRNGRGHEMQFATNHLGHFRLTARLWGALKNAGDTGNARVINVSSAGHRFANVDIADPDFLSRPYDKWKAYGQSKTANSLFSVALDRRGRDRGIRAFAVHPGRILATDLVRHFTEEELKAAGISRENGVFKGPAGIAIKSIEEGAATTVWCALSPRLEGKGGVYCADCDISRLVPNDNELPTGTEVRRWAVDPSMAEALWELSGKWTGIAWPD